MAAATHTRQEFGDGGQDEEQAGQRRPALALIMSFSRCMPYGSASAEGSLPISR